MIIKCDICGSEINSRHADNLEHVVTEYGQIVKVDYLLLCKKCYTHINKIIVEMKEEFRGNRQ